jgi:ribosome assembly protein YihI (activator of Der GTPase)
LASTSPSRPSGTGRPVLAEVKVKIDEFEERLSAYMRELGIEELDEAEIEVLRLAEPLDFAVRSQIA